MGELLDYFQKITPAELARLREKDQRVSTRDKERLLKKVAEIEEVVNKLGEKILIKQM